MKKLCLIIALALILTGCGAQETFETVNDPMDVAAVAQEGTIIVNLPQEAAANAMESEDGTLYLCGSYHVVVQTLPGGDLDATLRAVTGYGRDAVSVMETERFGMDRYDFVWTASSEQGDQVGHGCVISDGSYHYCVSTMGSAEDYLQYEDQWEALFSSFYIN